jgi:hypothetical protein
METLGMKILALLFAGILYAQEATIIDTGSTNTPGMTVSMAAKGHAMIEHKDGQKTRMNVSAELRSRLMKDLEAAGPLDQMKTKHCFKSVSFGSKMFVEYKGLRSPDISCPGQADPKVDALRTDVEEIMAEARRKQ